VDAVNGVLAERSGQGNSAPITEEDLSRRLYTNGLPDPDLLIRTSGEVRVSNFLLWQIAYAEIFVTETLWPDFNRARLLESFLEFQKRERRYGGIREGGSDAEVSARVAGE
jgi:undecaprenyl diphosphate synthase